MFACRACTRRVFLSLSENASSSETANCAALRNLVTPICPGRTQALATAAFSAALEETATTATKRETPSKQNFEISDADGPKGRISKSIQWAVNKQLQYLNDPLFIAQHVEKQLAKDRFEEAAHLVRKASKTYRVSVSWNHLIDYQLRHNHIRTALKLYSEMKKRAQLPTAQTYTIMFRGFAMSQHPQLAVAEAVKLYNTMLHNPNERVRPNTIHLNAVLQVCAKAYDLDTMFGILASTNENLRAPNNQTYTLVLNALRAEVMRPGRTSEGSLETETKTLIQRAQAIWNEVIAKWRSASIVIDEELVCAMGRILLLGDYRDNESILSLIEQTMGVPTEGKALDALVLEWKRGNDPTEQVTQNKMDSNKRSLEKSEVEGQDTHPMVTHAKPGNNSLSLILSSLDNRRVTTLAPKYWDVFTKVYSVVPDAGNWYSLLATMRRGKNSGKAVEYLRLMPKKDMTPTIFRIAMRTCLRDNINKSAFNNATQVLEVMVSSILVPDIQTMTLYLRVAYANKRLFQMQAKTNIDSAKLAWGKQITVALHNLWEPYQAAAKQFTFGGLGHVPEKKFVEEKERQVWVKEAEGRAQLAVLARKMVAAYDRLIFESMVPMDVVGKLTERKNRINRFIGKYFGDREKFEPGWNRKVQELSQMSQEEEDEERTLDGRGAEAW